MRTYCVRQKKETECIPGSEKTRIASNGRKMLVCQCAECGSIKTQFVKVIRGGAIGDDFACGYNLKGKKAGTAKECFKKGQVRYWGLKELPDDSTIDMLLADRKAERNRKAREKRASKPKQQPMSAAKRKQYIDEIVADIKKERRPAVKKPVKSKKTGQITKKQINDYVEDFVDKISENGEQFENLYIVNVDDEFYAIDLQGMGRDEMQEIFDGEYEAYLNDARIFSKKELVSYLSSRFKNQFKKILEKKRGN